MASKGEDSRQIKEEEPIQIVNCDEGDEHQEEDEEEDHEECLEEQPENVVPVLAPVSERFKKKPSPTGRCNGLPVRDSFVLSWNCQN